MRKVSDEEWNRIASKTRTIVEECSKKIADLVDEMSKEQVDVHTQMDILQNASAHICGGVARIWPSVSPELNKEEHVATFMWQIRNTIRYALGMDKPRRVCMDETLFEKVMAAEKIFASLDN